MEQWCFGDQYEPEVQARLVAGAQAVIHIAMDWKALNDGPRANLDRNVAGTLHLLETARQAGVGAFVFVSSLDVYGREAADPARRLTETDLPRPESIYAAFKASVEEHLCAYHATFGMSTSSWRPAAIYGVKPGVERSLWLDVLRRVRHGGQVTEPTTADVVSVDDVAEALALAVGDETVAGEVFNLVDARVDWPTVSEMARRIIGKTEATPDVGLPTQESHFDPGKAIRFFDRHGNREALRRGLAGIAEYLTRLLAADANHEPEKKAV